MNDKHKSTDVDIYALYIYNYVKYFGVYMQTPFVNLNRIYEASSNPFAPVFEPEKWNDAGDLNKHFVKVVSKAQENKSIRTQLTNAAGSYDTSSFWALLHKTSARDLAQKALISEEDAVEFMEQLRVTLSAIQLRNNCYTYGSNDPYGHFPGSKPQPGYRSGLSGDINCTSLEEILENIRLDGVIIEGNTLPSIRPEYYRGALYLSSADSSCYHFAREDQGGQVSHKDGHGMAGVTDCSGAKIESFSGADMGCYDRLYCYLQFPAMPEA